MRQAWVVAASLSAGGLAVVVALATSRGGSLELPGAEPAPAAPVATLPTAPAAAPLARGALDELTTALRHGVDAEARAVAARRIAMAGPPAGEAAPAVIEALAIETDVVARREMVAALEALRVASTAETLARLARGDPDPRVRTDAVTALGQVALPHAAVLIAALDAEADDAVQAEWLRLLARRAGPEVDARLVAAVGSGAGPSARGVAALGLATRVGEPGNPAFEALRRAAETDREPRVRAAAGVVLARAGGEAGLAAARVLRGREQDPGARAMLDELLGPGSGAEPLQPDDPAGR